MPKKIPVYTDDLLTIPAAAKEFSRPRMTIWRWAKSSRIIQIRLGNRWYIPKSEIERIKKEETAQITKIQKEKDALQKIAKILEEAAVQTPAKK